MKKDEGHGIKKDLLGHVSAHTGQTSSPTPRESSAHTGHSSSPIPWENIHSTRQAPLRTPSNFTREEIEEIMLSAVSRPMYEDSRNQHHQKGVVLQKMGIFLELHKSENDDTSTFASCRDPHYHVALQGERSFRYLPMKKAIRVRYGLETHWS